MYVYETYQQFNCKHHFVNRSVVMINPHGYRDTVDDLAYRFDGKLVAWKLFTGITVGHELSPYNKKLDLRSFTFYKNGMVHRLDGPARLTFDIDHPDSGPHYYNWVINNKKINHVNLDIWCQENDIDLGNLSEEDKFFMEMKYGNV